MLCFVLLAACVRPVEPTPTPGAASPPPVIPETTTAPVGQPSPSVAATQPEQSVQPTIAATPAPVQTGASVPIEAIQQWLQGYGVAASNLAVFREQVLSTDTIVGFTLNDPAGQSCVGIIQALAGVILTGDVRCYPAGTAVLTGTLPFAVTANNEFYVAIYGYALPQLAPGATAVSVLFPDSSSLETTLSNSGFILLQPGVIFPALAVVIDAGGNTVATVPFQ